jgi:hypothetical protein
MPAASLRKRVREEIPRIDDTSAVFSRDSEVFLGRGFLIPWNVQENLSHPKRKGTQPMTREVSKVTQGV